MTSTGICQSVTLSNDTSEIIAIPRYIMVNVIKELDECDITNTEVKLLREQYILQNILIEKQDSINAGYKNQIIQLECLSIDKDAYIDTYKSQLQKTSKELKREKQWNNFLKITGAITTILLIVTL